MARPPRDDDDDEEEEHARGRKRRGHRDAPRPPVEGEIPQPPAGSSNPAEPTQSGHDASRPYKPPHELTDEEIDEIVEAIVEHAYGKHKEDQGEFPNVGSDLELIHHVKKIIKTRPDLEGLPITIRVDAKYAPSDKALEFYRLAGPIVAEAGASLKFHVPSSDTSMQF